MFTYWGFGLHIASEIEFPELLPASFVEPDITISFGATPESINGEGMIKRAFSFVTSDEYLLSIKGICKYYAAYGSKIIVEPVGGIDEKTIRLFLLGSVMAALLYQRGCIPVHAAAIVKDDRLILFAGNSGAGKSTLTAFFGTKGYQVFTDDICVMRQNSEDKQILCTASYPMMKLWDDAISKMENDMFTRDFKIRPQSAKYGQFFYDTFSAAALPVDKIFILTPKGMGNGIQVSRLTPLQAFKKLELQAYRYQLIAGTKMRERHFSLLSGLISSIPVYEAGRPRNGTTTVEELSIALENHF